MSPLGSTRAAEGQTADPEKNLAATSVPDERPADRLQLQRTITAASNHDMPPVHQAFTENEEIYNRLPLHRKQIMTGVLAFCGFLAPISSTTVLAAVPEVAATYNCDGTIINLSNAFYMLFMGLSPMFWGPIGQIYGRRWALIISGALFLAFSIGSALAPNLASFFIFRILTAFQGTSFLIIGSSCIGDVFKPTERATAMGWFFSGTLIGPAFGPFIGGVIVTFKTWRDIFWLQSALAGFGTLLVILFLPETIHYARKTELQGLTARQRTAKLGSWINPLRVLSLYRYPNLLAVALASSSLVWNMYSLLTPIRYVLNPRFGLTSPIQSGLFYIAPGCGYLLGTFVGGRWADHVVKKWIKRRGGRRVPEDRLRSCLAFLGAVIPGCMLIYGWSIEKRAGGIALPVIFMFVQGVAQLFCFPSLNTYCLDVMKARSAEVVASNYVLRYLFGALGTAVCLPAVRRIGVGWFSTVSAGFLVASTGLVYLTTLYGRQWAERVDAREKAREVRREDKREMQGCELEEVREEEVQEEEAVETVEAREEEEKDEEKEEEREGAK